MALVAALAGAAVAALAPQATLGALSPIVIAVGLGGVVLSGPRLTLDEVTPLTLTAWSASSVTALALTGLTLSLLGVDLSISNVGLSYLLWTPTIALAYLAMARASHASGPDVAVAESPVVGRRLHNAVAYLAAIVIPACVVVALLLGAQPHEGPTLSVWILPATGGVAGDLTVRPGATYEVVGGVQAAGAGDRRVEVVIELAGVESVHRSFSASETPAPFTSAVTVPSNASGSVPVTARARFVGEPASEVRAVLRLVVTP
jgi:hypothetical protein